MKKQITQAVSAVVVGWFFYVVAIPFSGAQSINSIDIRRDSSGADTLPPPPIQGRKYDSTVNTVDINTKGMGAVILSSQQSAGGISIVMSPGSSSVFLGGRPPPTTGDMSSLLDKKLEEYQHAQRQALGDGQDIKNCKSRTIQLEQGGVAHIQQCGNSTIIINGKPFVNDGESEQKK